MHNGFVAVRPDSLKMKIRTMKTILSLLSATVLFSACQNAESKSGSTEKTGFTPIVSIVGEMRNVMHKGELFGTIDLDTISNKSHLYGLGPVEFLQGEILIVNGKSYISKVFTDSTMNVEESFKVKAPFFVYSNVEKWVEKEVPDSVQTIQQLELFLDAVTKDAIRPFAFRLIATVDSADIHIVNLPLGTEVHSPEEAHQNQKTYKVKNSEAEIIGFFSTEHAGVFIHHDSFIHMHLITKDKEQMGHVDKMDLKQGAFKLYLPLQKN